MPCQYLWYQVRKVEEALNSLVPHLAIPGVADAMNKLASIRGTLLTKVGIKYPKTISSILKLAGLSPGTITLWLDVECGWLTEARDTPGAPPVYHYVKDEVAMVILKGELTHELEVELMTPDEYLGE